MKQEVSRCGVAIRGTEMRRFHALMGDDDDCILFACHVGKSSCIQQESVVFCV